VSSETLTKPRPSAAPETDTPPRYRVLLLNDDYTTWDFVIFVLMRFFRKSEAEAEAITLEVHQKGVGLAGVYPFEVAETKATQVIRAAREEGYPLRATVEPE
jgi:ATP-dependent Clp protease adaptor protein ClpS